MGYELGSSSGTGYETLKIILNLARQVAPTLGPASAAFPIGLNRGANCKNIIFVAGKSRMEM